MKQFLVIAFFLINTSSLCFAQEADTIYFDLFFKKCLKEEAKYYRTSSKQDDGYLVKEYKINDINPMTVSICSAVYPITRNGKYTSYHENAKKQREGNYKNDKYEGVWTFGDQDGHKIREEQYVEGVAKGIWKFFEEGGKDSSVIECNDKIYKNIRISKNRNTPNDSYDVTYLIHSQAEFPGGVAKINEYVKDNIKYPKKEVNEEKEGTCYITFEINEKGETDKIKLLRGVPNAPGYDEEALRLVKAMPKWAPALQYGIPVKEEYNLPVRFTVRKKK